MKWFRSAQLGVRVTDMVVALEAVRINEIQLSFGKVVSDVMS